MSYQQLMKDQHVLVTGGTAGIGKAIASLMAKEGAHVIIWGTHEERGLKAQEEIRQRSPANRGNFQKVDVSCYDAVEVAARALLEEHGKLDVLINNAGITKDGLLLKMSEADWDTVLDVNLKSVFNTCKGFVRSMVKARKGSIINISSVVGLTGNAGQGNYAASKSGMIGLTKSLAKELAGRGIRANCIAPGYIETQMTEELSESIRQNLLSQIPLGRMGQGIDIAQAALYLASSLSSYVTGQVLTVDGGMVI